MTEKAAEMGVLDALGVVVLTHVPQGTPGAKPIEAAFRDLIEKLANEDGKEAS